MVYSPYEHNHAITKRGDDVLPSMHSSETLVFKCLYRQEDGMLFSFTSRVGNVKPDQQGRRSYQA